MHIFLAFPPLSSSLHVELIFWLLFNCLGFVYCLKYADSGVRVLMGVRSSIRDKTTKWICVCFFTMVLHAC